MVIDARCRWYEWTWLVVKGGGVHLLFVYDEHWGLVDEGDDDDDHDDNDDDNDAV